MDTKKNFKFQDSTIVRAFQMLEKPDRRKILWIIVIQAVLGFLDLIAVVFIGGLGALSIQGIESQKSGNRVNQLLRIFHIQSSSLHFQVAFLGLGAALIFIIKTMSSIFFTRKTFYFLAKKGADASVKLISKILKLNLVKIQELSNQQILFSVSDGVKDILVGILATIVNMASDFSTLLILGIGLFLVDPALAVGVIIIFATVSFVLFKKLQFRAREIGLLNSNFTIKNNQAILEVLNSYRETVVRHRQSYYSSQIKILRYKLGALTAEINFQPYISKYVIESTSVLGALVLGGYEFATKNAVHAAAVLAVFLAASSRIAPSVLRLQQGFLTVKSSSGSAASTFKLIHELKEVDSKFGPDQDPDFKYEGFLPEIELNCVTFTYPESNGNTLKNVSIRVESGSSVAIVGPSGAGKTTLVDLILGVLEPQKGTIKISGLPPQIVSKKWPGGVAYVPQNTFISHGTVRENVALGYRSEIATDERILRSLQTADIDQVVLSMPQKFETDLGEQGSKLSGGQRQRIGIARALFTSPKLLVLDEATSSLDGQTELNVSQAITELSGIATVLIVAHRLSTVRKVDQIIYLEKGEIKASGTFEEVRNSVPDFDKQAKLMGL
jgi:ABC-type multidrug transport system fused ATPase/permease subunit